MSRIYELRKDSWTVLIISLYCVFLCYQRSTDSGLENPNCISLAALSKSGFSEDRQSAEFPQFATPMDVNVASLGDDLNASTGQVNDLSSRMDASNPTGPSRSFSTHGPGTSAGTESETSEITEVSSVVIIDQHTYEALHAFRLNPNEMGYSIISANLEDDSSDAKNQSTFYVVGTTYVLDHQAEPDKGRLIVLQWNDSKLNVIAEKEIKGCPYSIQLFNGKILCAINHMVELYEWAADRELRLDSSHYGNVVALHLKTKGDFVLVGDLLKSVSLLLYKPQESSLEEIAKDYTPLWTTAVEILDDDTFLVGENNYNLYTVSKDSAASTEEERRKLTINGRYHVNDMINVFRHGSLVMNNPNESILSLQPSILFGTVSGAIGLIVQMPPMLFTFLSKLQEKIVKKINSVGMINHSKWREFAHEFGSEPAASFIDGDVIELFLDMTVKDREDVVKGLSFGSGSATALDPVSESTGDETVTENATGFAAFGQSLKTSGKICADEVVKLIEDLARLH